MKKSYLFGFGLFVLLGMTSVSCSSNKTGCRINDNAHVKMGKDGQLPTRRGKSELFPKKMRKKR